MGDWLTVEQWEHIYCQKAFSEVARGMAALLIDAGACFKTC